MIKNDAVRRLVLLALCLLVTTGVIVLYASSSVPEAAAPLARGHVSANHINETEARNAVTAVYLNYRLWDTLFESLVLLICALAVINLSWSSEKKEKRDE